MMTEHDGNGAQGRAIYTAAALRSLSPRDFAQLGMEQVAYVRPALMNGKRGFSIHAADGTPIGAAPNTELAAAAIVQHEMVPLALH
jgi:hypothetical protein